MGLIQRTTKGSPLTWAEGDANLTYLEGIALTASGNLSTTSGSLNSNLINVSSSFVGISGSYNATSASYYLLSGSDVLVSSSYKLTSASFYLLSGSATSVSGSYNVTSASYYLLSGSATSISGSYNTTSGSLYTVSSSLVIVSSSIGSSGTNLVWANIKDFGAVGNGTTDDSLALSSSIATGKTVYIPAGIYLINTGSTLAVSQSIIGTGPASVLYTANLSNSIIITSNFSTVKSLYFKGAGYQGLDSVAVNQNGVKISGSGCVVSDSWFEELRGSGVWIAVGASGVPGGGNKIINCSAHHCTVGVYSFSGAEYSNITGVNCNECFVGFWEIGGNTQFDACQADWCTEGFRLSTGANDGHSHVGNSTFNHCTTLAINIQGSSTTFTFNNCDIWNGGGIVFGSTGVANNVILQNSTISNTPISSSTQVAGCYVRNCYLNSPIVVTTPASGGLIFVNNIGSGTTSSYAKYGSDIVQQLYSSGSTYTITNQASHVWLNVNPTASTSNLVISMSSAPVDNQKVEVSFGGIISSSTVVSSLTMSANTGQSILHLPVPASASAGTTVSYRYKLANTTWYRLS